MITSVIEGHIPPGGDQLQIAQTLPDHAIGHNEPSEGAGHTAKDLQRLAIQGYDPVIAGHETACTITLGKSSSGYHGPGTACVHNR